MNDLEYLRRISQTNRAAAKKDSSGLKDIFKSKIFKIAMVGLALTILIMMIGSLVGQTSGRENDALVKVNLRVTNLSTLVKSYNSAVKSSKLRAMGASLSSILSETSRDLYAVLVADYDYDAETVSGEVTSEEAVKLETAKEVLERAKLNGVLDRTYLHQLIYEVASLMSLESEALARTGNDGVKQILQNSMNSLEVLYEQLSNYSDSTN